MKRSGESSGQQSGFALSSQLASRLPIYYGWIIIGLATLLRITSSPSQNYALSVFVDHFIVDLEASRSLVSSLRTIAVLLGSLSLPVVGRQIDRLGSRRVVTVLTLLLGLSCVYMSAVRNTIMLGIGLIAFSMWGQGGLILAGQTVINQWWVRHRGTVMGIHGLVAFLAGFGACPNLLVSLTQRHGWRLTYVLLGLVLLLVVLPLNLLLWGDRPEDYGLEPDGAERTHAWGAARTHELMEQGWTLADAVRTPVLWFTVLGLAVIAMTNAGLQFHMVSVFQDSGLTARRAASAFVPTGLVSAFMNVSSGVLVSWVPVRFLLSAALGLQVLTLGIAQRLASGEMELFFGACMGATMGLQHTVAWVVWPTYFGRRHLGSISGATTAIQMVGSALGPIAFGVARDLTGSHRLALTASAVVSLLLVTASLFAGKPERSD